MKLYNNIDVVQINIKKGVDEYYLPKNVNWRDRTIDKILLVYDKDDSGSLISPIDGQTILLGITDIQNLYFDIYASDDLQIFRNVHFESLDYRNNNPLAIGTKLSLNLSRLYFTDSPQTDGCILLYVYYGTKSADYAPAQKSVTVEVPLAANGKMTLQDIMDNYILTQPDTVKGIYAWDGTPTYITLRDKDGKRCLNDIYSELCRPPMYGGSAPDTQVEEFRCDNINIDFLNSFVQNATNTPVTALLTFNY